MCKTDTLQIEAETQTVQVIENEPPAKRENDVMIWDSLLESFGRITTESNSTDGSLEDITSVDPLATNNNMDITELLFDNATNNANITNIDNIDNANIAIDYDLSNLEVLSPFNVDKIVKKDDNDANWVVDNVDALQPITLPPPKMGVASKAMQLALANEIEIQAPWIDVTALASSIQETPVSIKENVPESIFTLATFVPTHMQSYIDLNTEAVPTANLMTQSSFQLDTPNILDVSDKVFNDSELVTNHDATKIDADIDFLKNTVEIDDRSLNTPSPSRVQHNIEINPSNSVLFNTDLALEDTLLFNNEPPSDMYVVKTENIFGKRAKAKNPLEQLAADAGICACNDCKCGPNSGECRNCQNHELPEPVGCGDDKCSCGANCECDHAEMKCAVGCGRATDTNHNTFMHYHKRHNNSNLEEFGVYTHECDESLLGMIDNIKCPCSGTSDGKCSSECGPDRGCSKPAGSSHKKSCCVTICFRKLDAFKQFLNDANVMNAIKVKNVNLTTSF